MVRDADAAMNRAKERGRARYELFDEGLRGRALSGLRVENDLRRALERDELTLEYQPMVSLQDFSIVGVEALLRWEHPERGLIAPLDFIPWPRRTVSSNRSAVGCSSTPAVRPPAGTRSGLNRRPCRWR